MDLLSGCSITSKSFLRFFYVLIDVVITYILNKISKIDNWSDNGRNLFYDEMGIFKNLLVEKLKEKNINANVDIYFDKLFKYIKTWFYNSSILFINIFLSSAFLSLNSFPFSIRLLIYLNSILFSPI